MEDATARSGAQELEHETAKRVGKRSGDISSMSSAENADTKIKDEKIDLEKVQSEPIPNVINVPRAQRRGLFARFAIVAEVTEPKHYLRPTKWFITFVVAMAAVAAPLGSTIIFRKLSIRSVEGIRLM